MTQKLVPVTIANGAALSPAVSVGPDTIVGIVMPASWTAAGLSFQVAADGTTFQEMQSSSAAMTVTAAGAQYIALDPALWRGVNALKVRSGTSGSPVNQGADRILYLVTRPLA